MTRAAATPSRGSPLPPEKVLEITSCFTCAWHSRDRARSDAIKAAIDTQDWAALIRLAFSWHPAKRREALMMLSEMVFTAPARSNLAMCLFDAWERTTARLAEDSHIALIGARIAQSMQPLDQAEADHLFRFGRPMVKAVVGSVLANAGTIPSPDLIEHYAETLGHLQRALPSPLAGEYLTLDLLRARALERELALARPARCDATPMTAGL